MSKKKRFKIYTRSGFVPYYEVINILEEDEDHSFVGTFSGRISKNSLLRIAKENYDITEDEIEFIE